MLFDGFNTTTTLTLDPVMEETSVVLGKNTEQLEAVPEMELTPEEQKQVDEFAEKIDLTNTQMILQYGAGSQKKIADFSESALNTIKTKDLDEVGELLTGVVGQLREFNEEDKGFFHIFKRQSDRLKDLKAKYDKVETNIGKITGAMENHQIILMKDVNMLDKMYELNLSYFKELSMYILAGKKKLEHAKTVELHELLKKAERTKLPEDTQVAKDFAAMCDRFEKKIYDLELTRAISLQMAPQIRLIQSNDITMSEKIQSTLVNTIPLWKSQIVIAIGLDHASDAAKAQHTVSDMTNELLKKNAEALKIASVETAKEAERGIVDIKTLKSTNQTLMTTLDDVMKIQEEGREKRRLAEADLQRIENEMRQKLLEISNNSRMVIEKEDREY
mgnify:FL=1